MRHRAGHRWTGRVYVTAGFLAGIGGFLPRALQWLALATLAIAGLVFVYAIAAVSATHSGKYGRHLLDLFAG